MLAKRAHQTLRGQTVDGGGEQIILYAHVEQAGDGAGGIVGVQRRKDQMAGERGFDRDLRRFEVADFARS